MPDLDADATGRSPSRRSLLRTAAGAGAAGLAATALTRAAAATGAGSRPEPGARSLDAAGATHSSDDSAATDAIVVHVRNAKAGEIDVFSGTSQVRLHDKKLAAHLTALSAHPHSA